MCVAQTTLQTDVVNRAPVWVIDWFVGPHRGTADWLVAFDRPAQAETLQQEPFQSLVATAVRIDRKLKAELGSDLFGTLVSILPDFGHLRDDRAVHWGT
jgi:hypothetical protein